MRISVREKGKRKFALLLPSRLIFNPLTATLAAGIINKHLEKKDISSAKISAHTLRRFSRSIMKYKRRNRGWKLVEVEKGDGTRVLIKL